VKLCRSCLCGILIYDSFFLNVSDMALGSGSQWFESSQRPRLRRGIFREMVDNPELMSELFERLCEERKTSSQQETKVSSESK